VLILGFPIKISVGFLFLGMLFSIMSLYVQDFLRELALLYRGILSAGSPL
jgi:flagellar biosynthetic protein FliR